MKTAAPTRQDQILRRRERAAREEFEIRNTGPDPVFSVFEVASRSGRAYRVQIRSLSLPRNGCTCPDFRTNLLGTCKHVEAVLLRLAKTLGRDALAGARPAGAQVHLSWDEDVSVRVERPEEFRGLAQDLLARFFDDSGAFRGNLLFDLPAFLSGIESLPEKSRERIQVADEVRSHLDLLRESLDDRRLLGWYLERVKRGDRTAQPLARPLYPFQVQGMLHLAFKRRALLADEMGLGKTVQAIAAALLLKEIRGIERVLVVCPASLKHQWAREIAQWTSLPARVVQGLTQKRRLLHDEPAFFTIVNYELTLRDAAVFEALRPDLVILDEAQRIRNWRTKTAAAVKAIASRYAFVLTGTPLENRLDDLYSLFQFIDPRILGPLWMFNERYFEGEHRPGGSYKVLGHKNLDELRARIAPRVLRRKKEEVLADLPDRVDNHYFVDMAPEQWPPYNDYKSMLAQLVATAERRPLTPPEEKRLLMALVKMRLICNALELHDPDLDQETRERTAPKILELEKILQEQVVEAGRKALVFSQWEGMIDIAARVLKKLGIGWVKLCGSVPTPARGALLDRFREDPDVRVFLSTDAGSSGLNLQAASLVVNLDVPWNPAVLEQRVGRSHRIGQREVVNVVNLVARDTIEERVLDALGMKREIFQGVFGVDGEAPDSIRFGERGGLIRRLKEVLEEKSRPEKSLPLHAGEPRALLAPPAPLRGTEPLEALADALRPEFKDRILLIAPAPKALGGPGKAVAVFDRIAKGLQDTVDRAACEVAETLGLASPPDCIVFDREGYTALLALLGGSAAGDGEAPADAFRAPSFTEGAPARGPEAGKRAAAAKAQAMLERGRNRHAFARHAIAGGFLEDAAAPLRESLSSALGALMILEGKEAAQGEDPGRVEEVLVQGGIVGEELAGPAFLGLGLKPGPGLAASAAGKVAKAADALLTLAAERAVKAMA